MFKEVTNPAGIQFVQGISFGASWGDLNGDTLPDLWVSQHFETPTLYLNEGDGTFTNVTPEAFGALPDGDTHAAAWADFDNDGDQDIIQLRGASRGIGSEANFLYINEGGVFSDQAAQLGVDDPTARGRTPLWLDFDNDGWLDLLAGAIARPDGQSPPAIYRQTDNGFENANSQTGFDINSARYGFLSDLSGDGNLDLVVPQLARGRLAIYDLTSSPFQDISNSLISNLNLGDAQDIVAGDFNGDLLTDLYITRSGIRGSGATIVNSNRLQARLQVRGGENGIQFNSNGDISLELDSYSSSERLSVNNIFIGSRGLNPSDFNFTLSPNDPNVQGLVPHDPGVDRGVYIGYDASAGSWQLLVSSANTDNLAAIITGTEEISQLDSFGFDLNLAPLDDSLLINTGDGFVDRAEEAGINNVPHGGRSIAPGDFDNDGDVDVYIVSGGIANNQPNLFLENQGDGTFVTIPDAGGATGTELGMAESVVAADYDLDGFLDLFLTNAEWPGLLAQNGPDQLFQNEGNQNNWLQIDLEGIVSNRDGIGAQVFVTSGGQTQLREKSGGIHRFAQHYQRLHFGLADNTNIDEILVKWPSGVEQRIENIPTNQLLRIVEPSGTFSTGQPTIDSNSDSGVFIWKESFDSPYELRTVGGEESTNFTIDLISTAALEDTSAIDLEGDDQLLNQEFGLALNSNHTGNQQDGVSFNLAPGAKALISVTQDGVANPRQLYVGSDRSTIAPAGWILGVEDFPQRPSFNRGEDLGLFVGTRRNNPNSLQFRWSGDGVRHLTQLSALASQSGVNFSPFSLGNNDIVTTFANGVEIDGRVGGGADGLNVSNINNSKIGFAYEQDNLNQVHRVNPLDSLLAGGQNAYWLPLVTPYGEPDYDSQEQEGIFLWKDEENFWNLRATAGGGRSRYAGSIISDRRAEEIQQVRIEPDDIVNTNDPSSIDFDFNIFGAGEDGLRFRFAEDASISLNLENLGGDPAQSLRIGAEQWNVQEVPLDLSGW